MLLFREDLKWLLGEDFWPLTKREARRARLEEKWRAGENQYAEQLWEARSPTPGPSRLRGSHDKSLIRSTRKEANSAPSSTADRDGDLDDLAAAFGSTSLLNESTDPPTETYVFNNNLVLFSLLKHERQFVFKRPTHNEVGSPRDPISPAA